MARQRSPDEIAEDLEEIKQALHALRGELSAGYVPRELYEARHLALRKEIALEYAAMTREMESVRMVAGGARALAMWCLGTIAVAVITALVGFVATGGVA